MRVLVTGGAGFIGSHLCDFLLARGCEVVCMDSLVTGTLDNIENWHQVFGTVYKMAGNYYFWVRWPDGKMTKTAKIKITDVAEHQFTPDN